MGNKPGTKEFDIGNIMIYCIYEIYYFHRDIPMSEQMLIRIDPELKEKLARIARAEGKSTSGAIRDLIAQYVVERDIGAHVDDLWERIGGKLKAKGLGPSDIQKVVKDVRRRRP